MPANDTIAMRTSFGCCWTNAFAASFAAANRVGSTSVARMLSDTSSAMTMMRCSDGRVTTALGRAMATIVAIIARRKRAGGTWRRNRWPGPIASRTRLRLAYRTACFFFRRSART